MTVKSVVVALGILASAGLAAGAQTKTTKKPAAKAPAKAAVKAAVKAPANLHFTVAPTGNEARYRVREKLLKFDFPTDAIGKTPDVTGMIVVQPNGTIVSDSSMITVNTQTLKSDQGARDRTLKGSSIETDKYPTVQFVPKSFAGLTAKPGADSVMFTVTGDLTVHGVTRPVTWNVVAHSSGDDIIGSAKTQFTFDYFSLAPPKKPVLMPLSVADTIKLKYDLHFIQSPTDKKP